MLEDPVETVGSVIVIFQSLQKPAILGVPAGVPCTLPSRAQAWAKPRVGVTPRQARPHSSRPPLSLALQVPKG